MKAFVLMPFAPDFDDIFSFVIRAPLESEGFTVERADEPNSARNIMHDVVQGILAADLVVADLTGANPNVFYELGIAHALGRSTVLLSQDLDDVPFDLRAYRVVTYSTHFARVAEATETLRKIAQGAKNGSIHFGSPVSDFASTRPQGVVISSPNPATEPSEIEAVKPSESGEVGLLDCIIDVQEGMGAINAVVTQMGQRFEGLNPHIDTARIELEGFAKQQPVHVRAGVRKLAFALDEYTRWLKPANAEYRLGLTRLAAGLDNLFAIDLAGFDIQSTDLAHLHDVFDSLGSSVQAAINMSDVLISVIESLPRVEKEFNRAKRVFIDEMLVTKDSLQQTFSVLRRAQDGAKRLQDSVKCVT
ncbi:nucleoside 2-deoxyribosyltransferase [Paucibacter sp. B51]|uniref:nucleoside 2-deoxyribosyltransferase n=1 Tax=Paucibacter sp. B51 TaxID=2993315 RepID=UPI0022EBCE3F|nr:nucleoside 2-deoxyribosyltransferase [Paucibacter sp. B51]